MFSKHRVEALSDGIFAIAMTLLILDIKPPVGTGEGTLAAQLGKDGASWITFGISFLLAGVFWMHQHRVFNVASQWSKPNVILTFVFLAFVCTLPFSTSVWGHHIHDPLAITIYFANQFALALVLLVQMAVIALQKHIPEGAPFADVRITLTGLAAAFAAAAIVSQFSVQYSGLVAVVIIATMRAMKRRVAAKAQTNS